MLVNNEQRNQRKISISLSLLYDDHSPINLTKSNESILRILSEQSLMIDDNVKLHFLVYD